MYTAFMLARTFPFWSVPLIVIFLQVGLFFKRRREWMQYICWFLGTLFIIALAAWFFFRGDLNSEMWIRTLYD